MSARMSCPPQCPQRPDRRRYLDVLGLLCMIACASLAMGRVGVFADLVGSSFQAAIQLFTSASSSATLRWVLRRSLRLVSSANHRSSGSPGALLRRGRVATAHYCAAAPKADFHAAISTPGLGELEVEAAVAPPGDGGVGG
jgi:hypothetical protein